MANIRRAAVRGSAAGAARAAEVHGVARGSETRVLRLISTDTTGQMSGSRNGPMAKRRVGTASGLAARGNARSYPGLMNGTEGTMLVHETIIMTRETISKGKDKKPSLLGIISLGGENYTNPRGN